MLPAADKLSYSRQEHIKSSVQIKHVLDADHTLYAYPVKCYFLVSDESAPRVRLAVVVPKKRFPRAVDRNRIKRLLRECFRLHKGQLAVPAGKCCSLCWIAVPHAMPTFDEIQKSVVALFQKINTELENRQP